MLSSRLRWLTLALIAALALPLATASGDAGQEIEDRRDQVEEAAGSVQDDAQDQAYAQMRTVRDTTRGAVGDAIQAAEEGRGRADALLLYALRTVDGVLTDAEGLVSGASEELDRIRQDTERRVPEVAEIWGNGNEATVAEPDYTPSTRASEGISYAEPLAIVGATAAAAGLLFWLAGGTAGAKAGAAGATGSAASRDLHKLLPYASPLFTRFERDTVLGHPKREALYGQIMHKPGVTLQDLCEETGLSRTAVSHHLRLLEQQHLIVSKRMGRSRHFFENGGRYGRDQKDAYAVLHNDRSKDVHKFISGHPGAIQKDLCQALGIQASVAHWHVKRLQEACLIETVREGRTVSYYPTQGAGYA